MKDSPCSVCPCWYSEEFEEPRYNCEGDEIGTRTVRRSWCDAPHCIHPQELAEFCEEGEQVEESTDNSDDYLEFFVDD